MRLLITFGIGLLIGLILATVYARRSGDRYIPIREVAIASQARQIGHATIVLGDSITEMADLSLNCGGGLLNAGLSGAKVRDVAEFAASILPGLRPKLVIVAVGTNDANSGKPTSSADFTKNYREIIRLARQTGANVVLMNVGPLGAPHFEKSRRFDNRIIQRENLEIDQMGLPVVNLYRVMGRGQGVLPDTWTADGLHPNAAGYVPWKVALTEACRLG